MTSLGPGWTRAAALPPHRGATGGGDDSSDDSDTGEADDHRAPPTLCCATGQAGLGTLAQTIYLNRALLVERDGATLAPHAERLEMRGEVWSHLSRPLSRVSSRHQE